MGALADYFSKETSTLLLPQLQSFANRANVLIAKINEYEKLNIYQNNNIISELSWLHGNSSKELQKQVIGKTGYFNQAVNTGQRLMQARQALHNQYANQTIQETLIESYKLINEIGEFFTGETIYYSITLPSDHGKISFEMDINTFCKEAINVTYKSGIALKTGNTFMNSLLKNTNVDSYEWSRNSNQFYNEANWNQFEYALKVAAQGGSPITFKAKKNKNGESSIKDNQGVKLESYFHWVNNGIVQKAMISHLTGPTFNNMVKSLLEAAQEGGNNDPYWTQGDIKMNGRQTQIKGAGASVVNTDSLKQQLFRFSMLMSYFKLDGLIEKINENRNKIADSLNEEITRRIQELGTQFLRADSTFITKKDLDFTSVLNELI